MAKESQKLDELNTESTDQKTIQKDGDEQINDISTIDEEKIETIANESSELSNKNIEAELSREIFKKATIYQKQTKRQNK